MQNTLYLYIVQIVGYARTVQTLVMASNEAEAVQQAKAETPAGLAYNVRIAE